MNLTNAEIARKLREIEAALTLKKGNIFQIRAYGTAATAIEHATSEIKDLWEEGKLDEVPGIGESLQAHLDELFKTGKVIHWEEVKKGIPEAAFEFLDIPGIGPKTAVKLAELGAKDIKDLKSKLESGFLIKKGFSKALAPKILIGLETLGKTKSGRMLLPYAFEQAEKVLDFLKKCPVVEKADVLGSLRRMVATIGDLDFAVASKDSEKIIEYIISMPGISRIIDKGERKVSVLLASGIQLDFLLINPKTYGSSLQYFTGSKLHNIHLRILAERKGFSLSEYGVKNLKNEKIIETPMEEEFYKILGMEVPPPEIREDTGEIEAALEHKLPDLVELEDIKGDLHLHDNFPIEPSHDLGSSSLEEIVSMAKRLGYKYIGISDHSPSVSTHNQTQMLKLIQKQKEKIDNYNYSNKNSVRVLNLLEVDIQTDGGLSVPNEGLKLLDFAIASVHSQHQMPREEMTKRILKALANPYVKILGHPTNRLINRRVSSEADWEIIFKYAAANNKALEINAYPDRLDLPDTLVRMAKNLGVRFVIDTDAHIADDMNKMRFGVAVARRGWLTRDDVINSWDWTRFEKWYKLK